MSTWRYTTSRAYVRQRDREDNARRSAYKREWEREHDFAICACGNKTSKKRVLRCRACATAEQTRVRELKDLLVEQMWADGYLLKDIAAVLHTSTDSLSVRINRLRKEGRAPLRHHPRKVKS